MKTENTAASSAQGIAVALTGETLDHWANAGSGPVGLVLRQLLQPLEGPGSVVFPPTYAGSRQGDDGGYNIDTLPDGTKMATLDSAGSQANRIEPMFKAAPEGMPENPLARLVPQIWFNYGGGQQVSIFDIGHRLADAFVRCTDLADAVEEAFRKFQHEGNASAIAEVAPTSLVFGVWDSRGTQAKMPRLVQSVIRAWNVESVTRSAQYSPPVDYADLEVFGETERDKAAGNTKSPLAQRGYVHVPSTSKPGGIVVYGDIRREVTVNLVALRRLKASDREASARLRRYILSLAILAAIEPQDGFLRQGCLVTPDPDAPAEWQLVARNGVRKTISLDRDEALALAAQCAAEFGIEQEKKLYSFQKDKAKKDAKGSSRGPKKTQEQTETGG